MVTELEFGKLGGRGEMGNGRRVSIGRTNDVGRSPYIIPFPLCMRWLGNMGNLWVPYKVSLFSWKISWGKVLT